jgi:outer membrane protein OmpA-like peptidoglycan-associated protein
LHHVAINLDLPRRTSSLIARGIYDASQFGKLADTGDAITAKVFFDFAQANLRPESNRTIEELVEYMERFPKLRIEIQGHTDNVGAEDFNQRLSENRAKAVLQALLDQGIESKRLRSRGFGMSQPVSTNSTEEGRQKNRRTQFMIWAK